jgi:hypothetical protein
MATAVLMTKYPSLADLGEWTTRIDRDTHRIMVKR